VPETAWVHQEKRGEGAFGEVWLADNHCFETKACFSNFCFIAPNRVRVVEKERSHCFARWQEQAQTAPNTT
jgi:hypothetical protein